MWTLRRIFGNWWAVTISTALLLLLLLVILLPIFVDTLRPVSVRVLFVLLIAGAWIALAAWRIAARRRASDRLAAKLEDQVAAATGENRVLARRMQEALDTLRARGSGDYLYSRPWYVIIGPSGAGKSTMLRNSGLHFPPGIDQFDDQGGTRDIDFYFSDEAVLIDTAGRYTTQDADRQSDRAAWAQLLNLLKANRPLQPVNGVIVAIGFDELESTEDGRVVQHAATVRERIKELQVALEVTVPIYVLFTKSDLAGGFVEFFGDLDVEGRRAVLGYTREWGRESPADLPEHLDALLAAVSGRMSARLQRVDDVATRGAILGFLPQLISLRHRLLTFLSKAFLEGSDADAFRLRGFYFTSGIQLGTTFDRILGRKPSRSEQGGSRRQGVAYFVNRLLLDVIVPEAGLVQRSAAALRRERKIAWACYAAAGAVATIMTGLWINSYFLNLDYQARVYAQAAEAQRQLTSAGFDLVRTDNQPRDAEALRPLDMLRDLPGGYADQERGSPPLAMRLGLYQSGIAQAARGAYLDALQRILLPRALLRLEEGLRGDRSDTIKLYRTLKVYLMLGNQAPVPLDRAAVLRWVAGDWETNEFPGPDNEDLRRRLQKHFEAMIGDPDFASAVWGPGAQAPLDGALLQKARDALAGMSLPQRAYALLKERGLSDNAGEWRMESWLPGDKALAFADGEHIRKLTVPAMFTPDGYARFVYAKEDIKEQLRRDQWVYGQTGASDAIGAEFDQVPQIVGDDYAADYIKAWDDVAGALVPADYFGNDGALHAATDPPSLIETLYSEIARNTKLGSTAHSLADIAGRRLQSTVSGDIGRALNRGIHEAAQGGAATEIDAHFRDLHDYIDRGNLRSFVASLRTAATENALARQTGQPASDSFSRAVQDLKRVAPPEQFRTFAAGVLNNGQATGTAVTQTAIQAAYAAQVLPFCRKLTELYPLRRDSPLDASIADMDNAFGRGHAVDSFIDTRLSALLDRTTPQWHWQINQAVAGEMSASSPEQFQTASAIRDLLQYGLEDLRVEPVQFGEGVSAADFAIGTLTLRFTPAGMEAQQASWNTATQAGAHVALYSGDKKIQSYAFNGIWALFRLLESVPQTPAGNGAFNVVFGSGTTYARFKISYTTDVNPFSRAMWSFRCSEAL